MLGHPFEQLSRQGEHSVLKERNINKKYTITTKINAVVIFFFVGYKKARLILNSE
ncbi:MAG: hypothetical protein NT120_00245 [Candidatus Aenigmarchaeota archaeon]|nr:hypothetical protein [Candidatus Aenigmarchaeota archaeon]